MLVFNSTRRLTEMAAEVVLSRANSAPPESSWRQVRRTSGLPVDKVASDNRGGVGLDRGDSDWIPLADLIQTVVLGGPAALWTVLTEDANGWSPTFSFHSRAEAERAITDDTTPLALVRFELESLYWADPVAFAEWQLDAVMTGPVLVADDLLVETQGRPLTLAGATVAEVRQGRISVVHTYFDEASLIEQVILNRSSR